MRYKRLVKDLSGKSMGDKDRTVVNAMIDDMASTTNTIKRISREVVQTREEISRIGGKRSQQALEHDVEASIAVINAKRKENRSTKVELLDFLRTGKFAMTSNGGQMPGSGGSASA